MISIQSMYTYSLVYTCSHIYVHAHIPKYVHMSVCSGTGVWMDGYITIRNLRCQNVENGLCVPSVGSPL